MSLNSPELESRLRDAFVAAFVAAGADVDFDPATVAQAVEFGVEGIDGETCLNVRLRGRGTSMGWDGSDDDAVEIAADLGRNFAENEELDYWVGGDGWRKYGRPGSEER